FFRLFSGPRLTFFSVVGSTDSLRFLPFNPFLVPIFFVSTIRRYCPIILSRKIKNFRGSDFSDFFQVRGLRFFRLWAQLIPCVFSHLIHSWFLFSSYPLSAGPRLTFFSVVASTDSLRFLPFNPFLVPIFFVSTISRYCPIILSRKIKNFRGS
ncbi:hypothetical protein JZ751_017212, partial [Albula glossodonta]